MIRKLSIMSLLMVAIVSSMISFTHIGYATTIIKNPPVTPGNGTAIITPGNPETPSIPNNSSNNNETMFLNCEQAVVILPASSSGQNGTGQNLACITGDFNYTAFNGVTTFNFGGGEVIQPVSPIVSNSNSSNSSSLDTNSTVGIDINHDIVTQAPNNTMVNNDDDIQVLGDDDDDDNSSSGSNNNNKDNDDNDENDDNGSNRQDDDDDSNDNNDKDNDNSNRDDDNTDTNGNGSDDDEEDDDENARWSDNGQSIEQESRSEQSSNIQNGDD